MNWRDRISILSRKRNHGSAGPPLNRLNDLPSSSGTITSNNIASNSAPVESVVNTLSQLRPVIGPDLKSYYILLRGDEDSFTCIQPAMDVINSLDEVVKNVINTLMSGKQSLQVAELPPNAKKPRYSQAKTYTSSLAHRQISSNRKNGIRNLGSTLLKEEKRVSSINIENLFLDKAENGVVTFDSNKDVENVLLHKRVQDLESNEQDQMVRTTSILESRLKSNVFVKNKQESCLFISSDCGSGNISNLLTVPTTEPDLIQSIAQSVSSVRRRDYKNSQIRVLNEDENYVTPQAYLSEPLGTIESISKDLDCISSNARDLDCIGSNTRILDCIGSNTRDLDCIGSNTRDLDYIGSNTRSLDCAPTTLGPNVPLTELSLIAKEGTVLTEDEITSQIKTLIESEQLAVGEKNQIVVIRVSAREALVKIVQTETGAVDELAQHQETEAVPKSTMNRLISVKEEIKIEEEDPMSWSMSPVAGKKACYNSEAVVKSEDQPKNMNLLLSQYSEPHQDFGKTKEHIAPGLRETVAQTADCVIHPLVASLTEPLTNEEQQEDDELAKLHSVYKAGSPHLASQVDVLETFSDSLIGGAGGEIVVFQREDGEFVNQDGTPVSSELQYLITSSQQDLTLDPEDDHTDQLFVPPDHFEHHIVDVNSGL
ncbi:uncharacterized protein [Procambarus clarkii]|uniref:uncharacterized protein isoform X1 n=1 Tax=Procambarus clarkii TaxID=6728 RepID=UPI00374397FB